MTKLRIATYYLLMAAFVCVTPQSALASKAKPLTCKQVAESVLNKQAILSSDVKLITISAQSPKAAAIQAALRAQLLKIALVGLDKLPAGKACDAIIAKIEAKFSRS